VTISLDAAKALRFYAASRVRHADMWRRLRDDGFHVSSSWIDEAGPGQTADLSELWKRVEREVRDATVLVLYVEPDDFPLKGALVETGMALASSVPIIVVSPGCTFEPPSYRPIGSWIRHPLCRFAASIVDGLIEFAVTQR